MIKSMHRMDHMIFSFLIALVSFGLYWLLPFPYGALILIGALCLMVQLKNIEVALCLFLVFIPFAPNMMAVGFILWVGLLYFRKVITEGDLSVKLEKNTIPLLILWVVMLLCTVLSSNVKGSVRDFAIHTLALLMIFILLQTIREKNGFYRLLAVLCYTSALVSLIGLYQYVVGVELDAAWVDKTVNPDLQTRVFSVFGNPNILAEYLIMITPLCLSFVIGDNHPFRKIMFGGIFVLNSLNILLTFSRGGWVGFAFALCVFLLLINKKFIWLLIPGAIFSFFILPPSIQHRLLTIFNRGDSSNNYRLTVWTHAISMIKDNFFSGVGLGYLSFKTNYLNYIRTMNVYHAHNLYLEVFAEMGIGGIIVFLAAMGHILKDGIKAVFYGKEKLLRYLMIGLVSGLLAVLIHGLFENILYMPKIILTFWVMIALCLKGSYLSKA